MTLQSWPPEEPGTQGILKVAARWTSASPRMAQTQSKLLETPRQTQAQAEMPVEVLAEETLELASGSQAR